jgi:predicted transglutaminase-like cysteine proteinase
MRKFLAAASAILFGMLLAGSALAETVAPSSFAVEFGKTKPPIGFVKFCVANAEECQSRSIVGARVRMTAQRWADLYLINTAVNTRIKPTTDQDLYGTAEFWTYPTTAGDCEDYLLLKKRELEAKGFPSSALLITVVLDERGDGHAVLTIASHDGDYVLDNRRDDILLWGETNYKFLKRQTQRDPRQWVSLNNNKPVATTALGTSAQ